MFCKWGGHSDLTAIIEAQRRKRGLRGQTLVFVCLQLLFLVAVEFVVSGFENIYENASFVGLMRLQSDKLYLQEGLSLIDKRVIDYV